MKDKLGLLTSIAIGDAFGRPFEFTPESKLEEFDLKKYAVFNRDEISDKSGIGKYTDDTQMSIAIAEHMIMDFPLTASSYAEEFLDCYKRDKRNGYSSRIQDILEKSNNRDELLYNTSLLLPTKSSNGAVMRCLPLGLLPDVERIKQACLIQSSVTHPSIDCILASQVIALAAHFFYYEKEGHLDVWINDLIGNDAYFKVIYAYTHGEVSTNAIQTASFCLKNVIQGCSMSKILERSIKVMGDVDSTAAISLGLASLKKNCQNDLPDELFDNLENNIFGRDYLVNLDEILFDKYPNAK